MILFQLFILPNKHVLPYDRASPHPLDGCVHGSPLDVAERLATVSHELSRDGEDRGQSSGRAVPEVWAVLQAFGGEGHWACAPSPNELRASVYVSLVHGAGGILLWLREGNTPQPLVQATKRLREVCLCIR